MKIKFEQKNPNDRKMTITSERRAYIYECAMRNEGPDGTFGDEECLLWEMFRHAYEYGKGERDGIW